VPNISLREPKRNETQVAEEYCCAITQAAGRSCCSRSGSSVFECGFTPNFFIHVYVWSYVCVYTYI